MDRRRPDRRRGQGVREWLEPSRIQPGGELGARKTKENQAKILGFAWISLAESGLFKGLRRKKIKKFGSG
jgi:hypothetical protein